MFDGDKKRIQFLKCYEQCNETCLTDDSADLEGNSTTMDQLPAETAEYLQYDMEIPADANLINVKHLTENGVTYSVNNIYVLDFVNDKPMFIKVFHIVVCGPKTLICGTLLLPLYFNSHLHSYVVDTTDTLLFFKPGSEICHHPHDMYTCDGKSTIRLRYLVYS